MKPISEKYERVFAKYYFETARQRFVDLSTYLEVFCNEIDFKQKLVIAVDHIKVNAFITSYYLDIIRFKEYHFNTETISKSNHEKALHTKLVSQTKAAAFTLKWMLKYQPLVAYAKDPFDLVDHEKIFLEYLPFVVALNFSIRTLGIQPHALPHDTYQDLLYHLRFRPYEERGFMLYFDLLVKHLTSDKLSV
jgi:hypothetical protein